jgi:hypothetical protein
LAPSIFWRNWIQNFEGRVEQYVTPYNKEVQRAINESDPCDSCGRKAVGMRFWEYVFNNVDYKLSEEWFTPEQTLRRGEGDCEDVTFLVGSMLLGYGMGDVDIAVGDLIHSDEREEEHTWVELDGMVIDATGTPEVVKDLTYKEVKSWRLELHNNSHEPRKNTQSA